MNKPLIPGRFTNVNGKVLRIRKRTYGCNGCVLNNIYACPNIPVNNSHVDCTLYNVIFTDPG